MTMRMKKELQSGEFDLFEYVSPCTLDTICGKPEINFSKIHDKDLI